MKKIKNFFTTKGDILKSRIVKLILDYPCIERGIDRMDTIFQKLMLGYAIILILLFCAMFAIVYSALPKEIKDAFSPMITIILSNNQGTVL